MTSVFIPSTTERVSQYTDEEITERISRRIEANVNYYATQDRRTLDIRLQ
jgi:elongation factor P hydroxylase